MRKGDLMKKYTIAIQETIVDEFEVEAKDLREAFDIAAKKYNKGEFVLCPGEVHSKLMAVVKPDCESKEWNEF